MDYCRKDGWGVAGLDFTVSGSRVHQKDSKRIARRNVFIMRVPSRNSQQTRKTQSCAGLT